MEKIEETNVAAGNQEINVTSSTNVCEENNHKDILIFEESKPYKLFISDIIY